MGKHQMTTTPQATTEGGEWAAHEHSQLFSVPTLSDGLWGVLVSKTLEVIEGDFFFLFETLQTTS